MLAPLPEASLSSKQLNHSLFLAIRLWYFAYNSFSSLGQQLNLDMTSHFDCQEF